VKPCWHLIKTEDTKKEFSILLGEYASEKEFDFVIVGCDKKPKPSNKIS